MLQIAFVSNKHDNLHIKKVLVRNCQCNKNDLLLFFTPRNSQCWSLHDPAVPSANAPHCQRYLSNQCRVSIHQQTAQCQSNGWAHTLFRNIIYKQCSHSAPVVSTCDSSVPFLTCGIPDLRFDCLSIHLRWSRKTSKSKRVNTSSSHATLEMQCSLHLTYLDTTRCKFHTDCWLRFQAEFIPGETW